MCSHKLLGMMTSRIGKTERYRLYRDAALQAGFHDLIVFTPEDVHLDSRSVEGIMFSPGGWSKQVSSYPCMLYDIGYYRTAAARRQARSIKEESGIPFAGDWLGGKWRTYRHLQQSPLLAPYLLPARLLDAASDARTMLDRYGAAALKPVYGDSGRGVKRLRQEDGNYYLKENGRDEIRIVPEQLEGVLESALPRRRYMLQQWIDLADGEGRVQDFRVLVQKDEAGQWVVAGMAARRGAAGHITSNPETGGEVGDARSALLARFGEERTRALLRDMRLICLHIARHAEHSCRKRFVEFGIDVGVDRTGQLRIIEVNEKPGKQMMKAAADDERFHRMLRRPVQYMGYLLRGGAVRERSWEHKADAIIADGMEFVRTPYRYGARAWHTHEFDCSSLMQFIFALNGIALPRDSRKQSLHGADVPHNQLRKGDLLFFVTAQRKYRQGIGRIGHIALYLGDGNMLHASGKGGVSVCPVRQYTRGGFLKAKRIIEDQEEGADF